MPAIVYKLQYDVSQKAELDLKCHCFHKFPKRHNEAEVKHRDLRGDFQQSQPTLKVTFGFREECLFLQLRCDLPVVGQDHAYSFRNGRNREDPVQRLQRFVYCEISFEATFHRRFVVLSLNVRHKSKTMSVSSSLVKDICDLN
jgi:hypothetical protein